MSSLPKTRRGYRPQKRIACQLCGERGRYDGQEIYRRRKGAWEWRLRYLCPICTVQLDELLGWDAQSRSPEDLEEWPS